MADSLGTLAPDVIGMAVLDHIKKAFPALNAVATDLSTEAVDYGKSVITRVVTVPSAIDYHTENGYVAADHTTTDVSVTINKHKHVTVDLHEQQISGSKRDLLGELARPIAYAIGRQAMQDLLAVVTTTNFTNTEVVVPAANCDYDTVVTMRSSLTAAGAPIGDRFAIVDDTVWPNIASDTRTLSRDYVDSRPDFRAGVLPNVAGFNSIFEYAELPTNSQNLIGFFASKQALVFAARVPTDPAALVPGLPIPGRITVVQDGDSGLPLMVRHWYDMQKGFLSLTCTLMYGVSKGVAAYGTRLVSSGN